MKKIFISFFVFGLMFFVGGFNNAQAKVDVSNKVRIESSSQSTASTSDHIRTEVSREIEEDVIKKIEEKIVIPTSSGWVNVGDPAFSVGQAYNESLVINSNNIPYIAYEDEANNFKATVMKFNGTTWESVGNPGFSAGGTSYTSLALDSDNLPYVAYEDRANSNKATVMKYIPANSSPSLTIIYPNGGETFTGGEQFTATWTSTGVPTTDGLYFGLIQEGTNLYYKLTGHTLNDGTEVFTIPTEIHAGQYKMYVRKASTNIFDYSDSSFTIGLANQNLSILSPAGGETFTVGQAINVTWTSQNISPTSNLVLGLYVDIGNNYGVVATTPVLNSGQGTITIPATALAGQYKIILSNSSVSATSNPFNVILPSVSDWVNVGTPGFSLGETWDPSIAINSDNIPYVAFSDIGDNYKISVKKFNGISWEYVGDAGFSASGVAFPKLAFDSNNIPYVAFQDGATSNVRATVMKFNGTNWVYVGAQGFSAGMASYISLALDSNNNPYISFQDYSISQRATVMKFNGTNWVNVGTPGFSANKVTFTSLALDSNGIPYVEYRNEVTGSKGTVMKFNGTSWVTVGGPEFSVGEASMGSLAIDSNNVPYVAFIDGSTNVINKASVMKFNGTNWGYVGNAGFSLGYAMYTSLVLDSNNIPYVAYTDGVNNYKATVMKWNGIDWVDVGTEGFSQGISFCTSLALDSNNIPYVTYKDGANGEKITVMKYVQVTTTPSLTITSPNGGEVFTGGQQFTANWTSNGFQPNSQMYFGLVQNGTNLWYSLTSQTLNDGTEVFTIPADIKSGQYKMYGRFTGTNIEDFSDNSFTIN